MAFVYTDWPTTANLVTMLGSANITLGAGVTTEVQTLAIGSAVNELVQRTGREFKPTASGVIRYYDGSGTGEMVIDDYVDITDISFFALPSQSAVSIANFAEVENVPFAKNRVKIYQGPASYTVGYYSKFPQGRLNIQVTGTFGYAATIPYAIWQAVLGKAAADIADRARVTPNGILTGLKDLDQDFKWSDEQIGTMSGWRGDFKEVCSMFKRPLRDVLKKQSQILI